MSFMDSTLVLWDNQALTGDEESRANGNILDMESGGAVDAHAGPVWFNFLVGTAFAGMASGAVIEIRTSDSATFASGVKCVAAIGCTGNPLLIADLAAGKQFSIGVPGATLHRYVEINWNVVSESASAGTLDAWVGMEPQSDLSIQKEPT
jgi:hypothetical protein